MGRSSTGPFLWRILQPTCLAKRAAQEEFDLRIETPQVVIRPSLHGFEQLRFDAKEKRLSV